MNMSVSMIVSQSRCKLIQCPWVVKTRWWQCRVQMYLSRSWWCRGLDAHSCSPQDLECAHQHRLLWICPLPGCSALAKSGCASAQTGLALLLLMSGTTVLLHQMSCWQPPCICAAMTSGKLSVAVCRCQCTDEAVTACLP